MRILKIKLPEYADESSSKESFLTICYRKVKKSNIYQKIQALTYTNKIQAPTYANKIQAPTYTNKVKGPTYIERDTTDNIQVTLAPPIIIWQSVKMPQDVVFLVSEIKVSFFFCFLQVVLNIRHLVVNPVFICFVFCFFCLFVLFFVFFVCLFCFSFLCNQIWTLTPACESCRLQFRIVGAAKKKIKIFSFFKDGLQWKKFFFSFFKVGLQWEKIKIFRIFLKVFLVSLK